MKRFNLFLIVVVASLSLFFSPKLLAQGDAPPVDSVWVTTGQNCDHGCILTFDSANIDKLAVVLTFNFTLPRGVGNMLSVANKGDPSKNFQISTGHLNAETLSLLHKNISSCTAMIKVGQASQLLIAVPETNNRQTVLVECNRDRQTP